MFVLVYGMKVAPRFSALLTVISSQGVALIGFSCAER